MSAKSAGSVALVGVRARRCPANAPRRSDCLREFVEGGGNAQERVAGFDAEFVVASPDVLDERVAADDDARGAVGLDAAHRSQPCFQPAVVTLDPVVRIPDRVV